MIHPMADAGYTLSTDDLEAQLERSKGRCLRVSGFPWWLMTLASPVWEGTRELREMRYLYDLPHALDAEPLAKVLPDFRPTPLDVVLTEHLTHLMPAQGSVSIAQTGR